MTYDQALEAVDTLWKSAVSDRAETQPMAIDECMRIRNDLREWIDDAEAQLVESQEQLDSVEP